MSLIIRTYLLAAFLASPTLMAPQPFPQAVDPFSLASWATSPLLPIPRDRKRRTATTRAGVVTTTKLPGDAEHRYEWDASGAVKSFTDPDSETTGAVTDLLGRPLSRTYPDGTVETIEYEGVRIKSVTDRQGRKQSYDYNAKGQLVAIRDAGGSLLDELRYDNAGRLERWTNRDSSLFYGEFDLHGNPGRTVQTRYRNGSAFDASPEVLDEYVQEHDWNGYGERTRFTMPAYPSMPSSSGRWTRSLALEYDALGNVTRIRKNDAADLMTASYRSAGRPDVRTIYTASGGALERRYDYDENNGLQTATEVYSGDQLLAGTRVVEYDGLQKRELQHLGVSGGKRGSRFSYDGRSRLENALIGGDLTLVPAAEVLTKSDFRTEVARTPPTPVSLETQTATEHPSKGHKLGTLTQDGETNSYAYDGSERSEDDRFVYKWDHKGRLVLVTEKPPAPGATIRRIVYAYDGNDRIVGRTAQMAAATPIGAPLDGLAWIVETRPAILTADGLPAETTFVWDPISDQLASIFRAGASKNPSIDSEGGLLRQILHGQLSYDDPIEVTARSEGVILSAAKDPLPSASSDVITLYPLYDESGTGSLQAIFDENARLLARSFAEDAYGDGESLLLGGAVDGVSVRAKKDAGGALSSVEIEISTTEPIINASLVAGSRLAVVDAAGTVVRTTPNTPILVDSNTMQWTLTAAEWNDLTSSLAPLTSSLSIAVTNSLRFTGWTDTTPMPAPDWALATQPVYTSPILPVEVREPLATLAAWLASLPASADESRTIYQIQSLPALGAAPSAGSDAARLQQLLTSSNFHAHPFTESLTGHNYVRARWYEPATGTWLSPDPLGYRDSSNLYAFCEGDPVNCSDSRGENAVTREGIYVGTDDRGNIHKVDYRKFYNGDIHALYRKLAADKVPIHLRDLIVERVTGQDRGTALVSVLAPQIVAGVEAQVRHQGSLGLSILPYIGDAKDAQEVIEGRDFLTGETLSTSDRVVTVVAAALPFVGGKALREAKKTLHGRDSWDELAVTVEEAGFLRNAAATFGGSSTFRTAKRFNGEIVIQRGDIPWSIQNVRLMAAGNTPFVRNSAGQWEQLNLHHVGRQDGKRIEILRSQNRYNPYTGGPLHIPGPGSPHRDRDFNIAYWQSRLQDAIKAGVVPEDVLRGAGLR